MGIITVRQAVLPDVDALALLFDGYRQFYGRNSDVRAARKFLLARFDHNESVFFIAHEDGLPVGFAQLYPSFSSVSLTRTFILNDLFVDPDSRRKGVGSQLMAATVRYAEALGAARVTLSTAVTNTAAKATYVANGWKRDEEFDVYHLPLKT